MSLNPLLKITDRILQRWSVSVGSGLANAWAQNPIAKPPPLPDDLAIEVDQEVMRAPPHVRRVIKLWYRTNDPYSEIAHALKYKHRTSVTDAWKKSVAYMTVVFVRTGIIERSERSSAKRERMRAALHVQRSAVFKCESADG